jgi:hypothetical protein
LNFMCFKHRLSICPEIILTVLRPENCDMMIVPATI